jgi:hypothetical protein
MGSSRDRLSGISSAPGGRLDEEGRIMVLKTDGVRFDINDLTVGEIRQLDHPVLKDVLLRVRQQIEAEASGAHEMAQHYSHVNFYSSIS